MIIQGHRCTVGSIIEPVFFNMQFIIFYRSGITYIPHWSEILHTTIHAKVWHIVSNWRKITFKFLYKFSRARVQRMLADLNFIWTLGSNTRLFNLTMGHERADSIILEQVASRLATFNAPPPWDWHLDSIQEEAESPVESEEQHQQLPSSSVVDDACCTPQMHTDIWESVD